MDYNLSDSSVKINNINHFNYNPELKAFVQNYLEAMPNLDVIKISDPACIREIEKVLAINEDFEVAKRPRVDKPEQFSNRQMNKQKATFIQPGSSRLLNALSGHRQMNPNIIRNLTPSVTIVNRRSLGNQK